MRKIPQLGLAAAAGIVFAVYGVVSQAEASPFMASPFTVSASVGGAPIAAPHLHYMDFGQTLSGFTLGFTGNAGYVMGSNGAHAAPYLSGKNQLLFGGTQTAGQDQSRYVSSGTGTVTMTFASPQTYLGLLWGSVDYFNSLAFYNQGALVGTVTGTSVTPNPTGNQGLGGTYYVNITSTKAFTSVVALSQYNSFEFDNIAYYATPLVSPDRPADPGTSVPEPSSLLLLGTALLGIGLTAGRRKFRL